MSESIRLGEIAKLLHEIASKVTSPVACGCPGCYFKGAPTPKRKFKVGDRVRNDIFVGTVIHVETYDYDAAWVEWDAGRGQTQCDFRDLTLYAPPLPPCGCSTCYVKKAPTPAELISTLKEHEWVRGTYKTGTAFGPCTTYYNKIGAMFAGDNHLIHWNNGAISDELATLERCDAPAPKPKGRVTKAHLFDGTIIEVENIAPEGGVTLYPPEVK